MKTNFAYRFILIGIITISAMAAQAQIKYYSNGQLTIGNTTLLICIHKLFIPMEYI